MKTKDLIKILQESDPSGELQVCIDNKDIHYIIGVPAYYDGCAEVLIHDDKDNLIGAKYISDGTKIQIKPLSIQDAIFNEEELTVEYETQYARNHYEKHVEKYREQAIDIKEKAECSLFLEYLKNKLGDFDVLIAEKFYFNNLSYTDTLDGCLNYNESWRDRRFKQWEKNITIEGKYHDLVLTKIN
jgi:hypothetical protein